MKRSKTQLLRSLAAMMLLSAGLASCSQDDMPQTGGTPLPEGEYPLTLTASVDGMNTRATGKDAWVDGDMIGVRIGTDDATGCYELNSDGSMKNVITPVYWQNTASSTVTAWYPYEGKKSVDISDQSKGFVNIDFLTATAPEQNYQSSVSLKFEHQMAKVSYTLQAGDGITEDDLKGATVQIAGYTKASFSEGILTGTDDGWITPASDNDALLVPKDMTGKPLIKVSINGKDFIYTPSDETAGNLKAGCHNTYTITVKRNEIVVEAGQSVTWGSGGNFTSGIEETQTYNLFLACTDDIQDISVTDKGGQTLSPKSENTYSLSTQGCIVRYKIAETVQPPFRRDGTTGGYAEISGRKEGDFYVMEIFDMSSDISISIDPHSAPIVGDYYYTDNSYSTQMLDKKENCVGVVFHVGPGPGDEVSAYDSKLNAIHGYVLAAYPACNGDRPSWCNPNYQKELIGTHERPDDWCGYKNTKMIINSAQNKNITLSADNYTHVYYATTYNQNTAPSQTSGWYLGSAAQMKKVIDVSGVITAPISNCGDATNIKYLGTSTERDDTKNDIYGIYDIEGGSLRLGFKNYGQNPRPILTF